MAARRNTTPANNAIVVGIDLNGLGVIRALGGVGVRVLALDTDLSKPTAATRFAQKKRIGAVSGPELVAELLSLRSQFDSNPVLLLTQEASVATVSAARDQLSGAYRFTMPSPALMDGLLNKISFQKLAERHNYPIPRALRLFDGASFEQLGTLRYPCIVKPTGKHPEYGKHFAKAYKAFAADEVLRLWSAMREIVDDVIVQEWIEGADSDVYFCLQYRPPSGGPNVSFVGRKTCQWPPQVGGTASCMPAPEVADELTDMTDGFFAAVGFVGVGSMEYKRDPRDGKFYMVEPTVGRTDYQEEIASLNGVNIPLAIFRGELGLSMPTSTKAPSARAWRDPFGHARALQAGALDPLQVLCPGIRICDAYRRFDDPMPYVSLKWAGVRSRLASLFHSRPQAIVAQP
jgi:predicted ATP-grasp superfamily ATP-dependent carboligase